MTTGGPPINRSDLAKALESLVADDGRVAGAIALCEAWEPGFVTELLTRAEFLVANDVEPSGTVRDRAVEAVDRVVPRADPRAAGPSEPARSPTPRRDRRVAPVARFALVPSTRPPMISSGGGCEEPAPVAEVSGQPRGEAIARDRDERRLRRGHHLRTGAVRDSPEHTGHQQLAADPFVEAHATRRAAPRSARRPRSEPRTHR